jgi:hypothetical protein
MVGTGLRFTSAAPSVRLVAGASLAGYVTTYRIERAPGFDPGLVRVGSTLYVVTACL